MSFSDLALKPCDLSPFVYLYPVKPVTSATRLTVAPPEHRFIQVNNCFVSEFVHLHPDVNGQDAHEVVGLEAADVVHGPSVRVLMFFFLLSFIYLNHPN